MIALTLSVSPHPNPLSLPPSPLFCFVRAVPLSPRMLAPAHGGILYACVHAYGGKAHNSILA